MLRDITVQRDITMQERSVTVQEIRYCVREMLLSKRAVGVEERYYCAGEIRYCKRDA
jgi:hypothetical protein